MKRSQPTPARNEPWLDKNQSANNLVHILNLDNQKAKRVQVDFFLPPFCGAGNAFDLLFSQGDKRTKELHLAQESQANCDKLLQAKVIPSIVEAMKSDATNGKLLSECCQVIQQLTKSCSNKVECTREFMEFVLFLLLWT